MSPEIVMQVEHLSKSFKLRKTKFFEETKILHAVNDVSFDVYKGETLGIIGESGCGKSTLGRCLVRQHRPSSGTIRLDGEIINEKEGPELKRLRRRTQMIFQDPYSSLNPRKTARQIIEEPFIVHKMMDKAGRSREVIRLMKEVGLNEQHMHRYPHEFSGGQRQRINIARALALQPEVIVCDEPVSALDVSVQAQVLNLLNDLQDKHNLTMVFISHDLSVIKHVSDRIIIMYLGRIVELCQAEEIYRNPFHPYTSALLSAIPPESPFDRKEYVHAQGDVPSPIGEQVGCPFAGRCPHVMTHCTADMPGLREVADGHQVACFLYENDRERRHDGQKDTAGVV